MSTRVGDAERGRDARVAKHGDERLVLVAAARLELEDVVGAPARAEVGQDAELGLEVARDLEPVTKTTPSWVGRPTKS